MASTSVDLLPGTLELLVLKALARGSLHGLGVSRRIEQMTRGIVQVKPGSLAITTALETP
jgi:PadR family transcriptional regulator, regulatory protein PadR